MTRADTTVQVEMNEQIKARAALLLRLHHFWRALRVHPFLTLSSSVIAIAVNRRLNAADCRRKFLLPNTDACYPFHRRYQTRLLPRVPRSQIPVHECLTRVISLENFSRKPTMDHERAALSRVYNLLYNSYIISDIYSLHTSI